MPAKISCREENGNVAQASGLCHSEAMTRTEKLLAELIALPKCLVEIV
jgi:hypothetical protein